MIGALASIAGSYGARIGVPAIAGQAIQGLRIANTISTAVNVFEALTPTVKDTVGEAIEYVEEKDIEAKYERLKQIYKRDTGKEAPAL